MGLARVPWSALKLLFQGAGALNILGGLLFFKAFTNRELSRAYHALFAPEGMVGVLLWGVAYLAAAPSLSPGRERQPLMYAVFAIEKTFYLIAWVVWAVRQPDGLGAALSDYFERDFLTGLFLTGFGLNDGLFGLGFAVAACKAWSSERRFSSASITPEGGAARPADEEQGWHKGMPG